MPDQHFSKLLRIYYSLGLLHLCTLVAYVSGESAVGSYQIFAPKTYTAFSGILRLNFTIPRNECLAHAFIALIALEEDHEKEIHTVSIGCTSGSQKIACGLIDSAGRYVFRMYSRRHGDVLTEFFFNVRWPFLAVSIPAEHYAFTHNISVAVRSAAKCNSLIRVHTFYLDLIFYGEEPRPLFGNPFNRTRIYQLKVADVSSNATYKFPCDIAELPGRYQTEFRSVYTSNPFAVTARGQIITKSRYMNIIWSPNYSVSMARRYRFPCVGRVSVPFEHPSCSRLTDRIRLYAMYRKVLGSLASPLGVKYRAERFAFGNITSVNFSCDLFDIPGDVTGYCFVYETMTTAGAVREQTRYCFSAKDNAALTIDGEWGPWSGWAECTASCGSGKQNRFRMCNNPAPSKGGGFCPGEPIEWKSCNVYCEKEPLKTPFEPMPSEGTCVCGCVLRNSTGLITATDECPGLSVWLVNVASSHQITLLFQYTNLRESDQWIKVRDGHEDNSKLIAFSAIGGIPDSVTSSSNIMRIEFMTSSTSESSSYTLPLKDTQEISKTLYLYGFIANYTISAINTTTPILIPHSLMAKEPEWENTVAAIGIIACVMMLGISIACGLYQRIYRRPWHKYTVASQGDSPYHAKGSAPSSPTSAAGNTEIEHDMEAPLTKTGSTKRKKQGGTTPGVSSPQTSVSSAGHKVKTKADVSAQSPYSANATSVDYVHNVNILKSSPSSKVRSTKVHPSSATTPISPLCTLNLEERVVPGASGTPTSSQNNGTASSARTPVNATDTSSNKSYSSSKTSQDKLQKRDKSKHFRLPTPKGSNRNSDGIPLMTLQDRSDYDLKSLAQSAGPEARLTDKPDRNLTTEFISKENRPRRPTSLVDDDQTINFTKASPMVTSKPPLDTKLRLLDGRRNQKPDGQSPELQRGDKTPNLTPLSIRSGKTLSPTRSLLTPSDATSEGCELEYDDFIMDDPLSYFDTEDTLKLRWQGSERIASHTLKQSDSTTTMDH